MFSSVYDFKTFYNGKIGRVVRRILQERIREIWPDVTSMSVMGIGYATPYLRVFKDEAEQVFALMPAGQGAHDWPHEGPNCVALSERAELPVETNSVDRVLMIHDLEFSEFSKPALQEVWRILKSNGRLVVIVPSRGGLWARADWSPFGQGTPYSVTQLTYCLRECLFVHERTEEALFMPPVKRTSFLKIAGFFERIGRKFLPVGAGVHIIEASKQVYATADRGSGSKVRVRGRGVFVPKPVANRVKS